jgi:hypothetical protein
MAADPIIYCLEHLTDYDQFERLCHDLMVLEGWDNLEPLGGMQDKGRDAIHISRSNPHEVTIFAYSVREDWQAKLKQDAEKIRKRGHSCHRLVCLTTAAFSASERDKAVAFIQEEYGWPLELYGLARLRVLLTTKYERLIAKHPQIFSPFFPVVGGVSLAFSPDYIIIDHDACDEALAVWLARRLILAGYLVWCRSTAPIAGASLHETIEVLLKQRAFRFLSILSPGAVTNPDMAARRATALAIGAQRQSDLLIPTIAEAFDEKAIDTRTRQLVPLRFNESWQTGLDKLLQSLEATHCPRAEGGSRIALRAFFPADVISPTPEKLLANRFPVQVPEVIYRFTSEQNIDTTVNPLMELSWAFRQVNPVTFLSFHDPPNDLRAKWKLNPAGGAVWTHKLNIDGILTRHLVPELIQKALKVAGISRGLAFCPEKRELYFPTGTLPSDRLYFNKPDGSRSYVATGGKRTFWRPGLSSEYRYFLVPVFSVERTFSEELAVITRLRLRFTDVNGVLLKRRTAESRRKHLCQHWWNDDWLHRILAVMQHLGQDGDIRIGDLPSNTIIIGVQPAEWMASIGINEDALAQADAARQELLIQTLDSDNDDDESEESESSD